MLIQIHSRPLGQKNAILLANALVSDGWIEKGAVFRDPNALEVMAEAQARAIAQVFPNATLITGIPACGAVLASAVARHLRLPVAFPILQDPPFWHRMHVPEPGHRVVQVDDLISSGTDTRTVLKFLRNSEMHVLGVSAWISRAELPGETLHTLAPAPFRNFPADTHPFQGTPIYTDIRE